MSSAPAGQEGEEAAAHATAGGVERPTGGWSGIGEALAILGFTLVAWLLTRGFAAADLMIVYGIDSAVVPRAVILTIALLAVLLLLGEKTIPRSRPRLRIHPRIGPAAFALASLVLYVATFETLGAFTLMPIFCAAISRAFVDRPLLSLLLYGVAVTVFTWVLFVLLLGVPLPGSRLPFL